MFFKSTTSHISATTDALMVSHLSDLELRQALIGFGYLPGPIVSNTRTVYERKLRQLQRNLLHLNRDSGVDDLTAVSAAVDCPCSADSSVQADPFSALDPVAGTARSPHSRRSHESNCSDMGLFDLDDYNSERQEMLLKIKKLADRHSCVSEALRREESIKQNQLLIMRKTHETQLEIKNSLIRNLEDIIDEQEARIFNLESHIAGIRSLSPRSTNPLGGVRRLAAQIDELSQRNTDLTENVTETGIRYRELEAQIRALESQLGSHKSTHGTGVSTAIDSEGVGGLVGEIGVAAGRQSLLPGGDFASSSASTCGDSGLDSLSNSGDGLSSGRASDEGSAASGSEIADRIGSNDLLDDIVVNDHSAILTNGVPAPHDPPTPAGEGAHNSGPPVNGFKSMNGQQIYNSNGCLSSESDDGSVTPTDAVASANSFSRNIHQELPLFIHKNGYRFNDADNNLVAQNGVPVHNVVAVNGRRSLSQSPSIRRKSASTELINEPGVAGSNGFVPGAMKGSRNDHDCFVNESVEMRLRDQARTKQLTQLRRENEQLRTEIQTLQDQLEKQTNLLVAAQDHVEEGRRKAQAIEADKLRLGGELNQALARTEVLEAELLLFKEKDQSTTTEQEKQIDELRRALSDARLEVNRLVKEAAAREQLEIEKSNLAAELESNREAAERRIAELDEKVHAQTLYIANLKSENICAQEKSEDLIIALDCVRRSIRDLRKEQVELYALAEIVPSDMRQKLKEAKTQINRLVSLNMQNLLVRYKNEMTLRKKYHNELVEMRGNIRVFCRVRPPIPLDPPESGLVVEIDPVDDTSVSVYNNGRTSAFSMDRVFGPGSTQEKVFSEVRALVTSCVDGYSVCIFAYGQTGSGKTYTMEGSPADPGINQRAVAALFEETEGRGLDWRYTITVSMMEIYNEMIRDLLSEDPGSFKLEIKLNSDGQHRVPNLGSVTVHSLEQLQEIFELGKVNRATASTNLNEHSSRSHALLTITVEGTNHVTDVKTSGRLNLVDLAGSERVSKSAASGDRLKEAQSINKSLSALGDVISALRNKQNHVPFRNSKLTFLLQDSLSGQGKALMVVQVAPISCHVTETVSSLNFAQRVRCVELGPASASKTTSGSLLGLNGTGTGGHESSSEESTSSSTPSSTFSRTPSRNYKGRTPVSSGSKR